MDFGSFFWAVLTDWIALVSGAASVVLSILGAIRKKKLPRWAWWTAAVICFLLASARVWTTEHRRANSLQDIVIRQIYPQFSCVINQTSEVAKEAVAQGNSVVLLIVTLRNTGAPSVADEYSMKVKLFDDSEVPGLLLTIPDRLSVVYPNGFARIIKSSQALYNKTVKPVGHNEISRGFLLFQFTRLSAERLSASAKNYELSLRDVYGKNASCSARPDQSGPGTTLSFPGLEDQN